MTFTRIRLFRYQRLFSVYVIFMSAISDINASHKFYRRLIESHSPQLSEARHLTPPQSIQVLNIEQTTKPLEHSAAILQLPVEAESKKPAPLPLIISLKPVSLPSENITFISKKPAPELQVVDDIGLSCFTANTEKSNPPVVELLPMGQLPLATSDSNMMKPILSIAETSNSSVVELKSASQLQLTPPDSNTRKSLLSILRNRVKKPSTAKPMSVKISEVDYYTKKSTLEKQQLKYLLIYLKNNSKFATQPLEEYQIRAAIKLVEGGMLKEHINIFEIREYVGAQNDPIKQDTLVKLLLRLHRDELFGIVALTNEQIVAAYDLVLGGVPVERLGNTEIQGYIFANKSQKPLTIEVAKRLHSDQVFGAAAISQEQAMAAYDLVLGGVPVERLGNTEIQGYIFANKSQKPLIIEVAKRLHDDQVFGKAAITEEQARAAYDLVLGGVPVERLGIVEINAYIDCPNNEKSALYDLILHLHKLFPKTALTVNHLRNGVDLVKLGCFLKNITADEVNDKIKSHQENLTRLLYLGELD